jgi:tetratricopeptide (TPR) repeat protein
VTRMPAIPLPTASEPRYERVHRLLRRYEAHLTEAEGTFLILFSAFRTPVGPSAFKTVFRTPIGGRGETVPLNAAIIPLNDVQFDALVSRLQDYRLIRYDQQQQQYTMHPLVRAHFLALLAAGDNAQAQDAHQRLKDYYLFLAGEISYSSTLDNLNPLIEVVHHACLAGAYDEAVWIYEVSVQGHKRFVLTFELGAYETALALLQDFFPDGDIRTTPRVKDPKMQAYLLNEVGLCLTSLGRLQDALHVYERSKAIVSLEKDLVSASITCQNLAEAHAYLGQLGASVDTARQALAYAREANDMRQECDSLAYVARAAYLLGDTNEAGTLFAQAEELQGILEPDRPYLYGLRGLWHAEYLWRTGDSGRAENITERNLTICEDMGWQEKISQCHRLLTDMYASVAEHEQASIHYHQAVEIAQLVSHRPVMIEALLGRGRWVARYKPLTGVEASGGSIFGDLDEALSYAREGDYRIHEADIRVAMAWVHLINGDSSTAQAEAERARQMSKQMGYYWGQVDANEVLAELDKREESSDE